MINVGNLFTFVSYSILLYTRSLNLLMVGFFVLGAISTIRVQIGVVYLYESLTKANYQQLYTFMSILDGVVGILVVIYFKFYKDWFYILLIGCITQMVGSVCFWFLQESPRYLIKSGQMNQAQAALEKIAEFNKIDIQVVSKDRMDLLFAAKQESDD